MGKSMTKKDLLPILEQYENMGCHSLFGRSGRLLRVSRLRQGNQLMYKFLITPDQGDSPLGVTLGRADLARKGLDMDAPALQLNSRVFVPEPRGKKVDTIFFLHAPNEIVAMLRANLEYLREKNDQESQDLYERITGMSMEAAAIDHDLCLDLFRLREESLDHIRKLLRDEKTRKSVIQALDQGEILAFYEKHRKGSVPDVEDLSDRDFGFLLNSVRARYFTRIQRFLHDGQGTLTDMGRKIFHKTPVAKFSPRERAAVFSLAIRAVHTPPTSKIPMTINLLTEKKRR